MRGIKTILFMLSLLFCLDMFFFSELESRPGGGGSFRSSSSSSRSSSSRSSSSSFSRSGSSSGSSVSAEDEVLMSYIFGFIFGFAGSIFFIASSAIPASEGKIFSWIMKGAGMMFMLPSIFIGSWGNGFIFFACLFMIFLPYKFIRDALRLSRKEADNYIIVKSGEEK